jgi:hypothetical protein
LRKSSNTAEDMARIAMLLPAFLLVTGVLSSNEDTQSEAMEEVFARSE